jgi:hypothetical protein
MADNTADREAAFHRGLEAYNAQCHFDAFDIWTQVAQEEPDETNRRFLQVLIQVTNAMHKVRHNAELRGSLHLLERALQKLNDMPDVYGGIDLATFRDATRVCLAEIARLLSVAHRDLDPSFIPPLRRIGEGPVLQPPAPVASAADPNQLFQDGLAAYREGRYYDAGEIWEKFRQKQAEDAPARTFLHGLTFVATAMHKLHRAKRPSDAAQLLEIGLDKLRSAPEGISGITAAGIAQEVSRVQSEVERLEAEGSTEIPGDLVPRIGDT